MAYTTEAENDSARSFLQDLTNEQRAYLLQEDYQSTRITQETFELNVAGDLCDLPAGTVVFAGGYIRWNEGSEFLPDRSSTVGSNPQTPVQSLACKDTTWTLGGRLRPNLPLVEDSLTIRGARPDPAARLRLSRGQPRFPAV